MNRSEAENATGSDPVPPVLVLAGGQGSRLLAVTRGALPKPLVPVAGAPFLEHVLLTLRKNGAAVVRVCAGHLARQVCEYLAGAALGSLFTRLDVSFDDAADTEQSRGTAHAVRRACAGLSGPFFVMNGDTLLDVPLAPVLRSYHRLGGAPLIVSCENRHPDWTSNMSVGTDGTARYEKQGAPGFTHVDAGLYVLTRQMMEQYCEEDELPSILEEFSARGLLRTHITAGRYYDVNTAESLLEAERFLLTGGPTL